MRKIDKIMCLWEEWNAAKMDRENAKLVSATNTWCDRLYGLEAALKILKEPSNTRIHMGSLKPGEPCSHPGCCNHITHPCEGCGRVGCQ